MRTIYVPPDVLIVSELPAIDPFLGLIDLVSKKRRDLESQGQGTVLRKLEISAGSWKRVFYDPKFDKEARGVDPGGVRLELPAFENLRVILGDILIEVLDGPSRP